jgi:hypothetical protein
MLRADWDKAVRKYQKATKQVVPAAFGTACTAVDTAFAKFENAKSGTDQVRKALVQLENAVTALKGPAYSALVDVIGMPIGSKEDKHPSVRLHMTALSIKDAAEKALRKCRAKWVAEPIKTKKTGKTKKEVNKELTL